VIDADELLAGKVCLRPLSEAEENELGRYREWGEPAAAPVWGQRAHMAIDFDKLLRLGLEGLREEIHRRRQRLDIARPEDLEKDAFYRACLIALEALRDYAFRYAGCAESMALAEADPLRRAELEEIASVCRRAPEKPAETFREAVQAAHFVTFSLCAGQGMLLFQLGRPDRHLLPFTTAIWAGRISCQSAQADRLPGVDVSEYTARPAVGIWWAGETRPGWISATS
jgi:hypothetical protein